MHYLSAAAHHVLPAVAHVVKGARVLATQALARVTGLQGCIPDSGEAGERKIERLDEVEAVVHRCRGSPCPDRRPVLARLRDVEGLREALWAEIHGLRWPIAAIALHDAASQRGAHPVKTGAASSGTP